MSDASADIRTGPLTIQDVARESGYSQAAVSVALNWRPGRRSTISTATREHILATANRLGYRPSHRAQALATRKSWQVAVLYAPPMGPVPSGAFQPVAEHLDEMLAAHKFQAVFIRVGASVESWMDALGDRRFDGVILLCDAPEKVATWMREQRLASVTINSRLGPACDRVNVDDRDGARQLVRHLIELGHRRISFFVARETRAHSSVDDRIAGYRETMLEAGLEPDEPFTGPIAAFVERIRTGPYRPTAVVDYEHWTAIRLQQELWRAGLRVPADFSIGTFNDAYPVDAVTPSLTTIGMPAREMSRAVVEMLLRQIEGEAREPEQREFKMYLTARESTAAPGASTR